MLFASFSSDLGWAFLWLYMMLVCIVILVARFAKANPKAANASGKLLVQYLLRRFF
jgi:hypothetical protein